MTQLKSLKIDVLALFAGHCLLSYYDPSSIWRMVFNFGKALQHIDQYREEASLESAGLTLQRDFIRIKNRSQWLLLEMKQPTLTLIKNFSAPINSDYGDMMDIECSPKKFSEDQKV